MDQRLTNFFLGLLSDTEKEQLFSELDANESLREEFAHLQNQFSLANMLSQEGDEEYAADRFNELKARARKAIFRRIALRITKYAAAILILIGTGLIFNKYVTKFGYTQFTVVEAPVGQRLELTLDDGTKVWLGPLSKLKIPVEFDSDLRTVELDGEGLFDVTKDKDRPFIVKTKGYNVRVLGTKFNVFAYSRSSLFETSLLEGAVEVYNNKNESEKVTLSPNEKVILSADRLEKIAKTDDEETTPSATGKKITIPYNNLVITEIDTDEAQYLQSGILSFEDKSFGEILGKLEIRYDVEFNIVNKSLLSHPFSAKFRESDNIETILNALQESHSFKFKRKTENMIDIY